MRELCIIATVVAVTGCGSPYTLQRQSKAFFNAPDVEWHAPALQRDAAALARWRAAVGSPIVQHAAADAAVDGDAVTIVSWNVALDAGDVVGTVRELQIAAPHRAVVLLLQEVFRSGDDVPRNPVDAAYAGLLGRSTADREVDDVARTLGFSLYYVPSMRNGAPGRHDQDRGNAILSNLPLEDLAAIELPFERQRRVALAARLRGRTHDGRAWSLRVANVHLDNAGGARRAWIGAEYARARQARGLREALRGEDPLVLAGDFNTWFGFSDQVYLETLREFPDTRVTDRRRTFRNLLRLDHVFYRLPPGWTAEVRRADSSAGSDHYPLITTLQFHRGDTGEEP